MRRLLFAGAAALLFAAAPASAQQRTPPLIPDTTAHDTASAQRDSLRISPRAALLRSLIIPGWGEVSAGSYVRGGVFFALAGASDYMLVSTIKRLSSAEAAWHKAVADSVAVLQQRSDSLTAADSLLLTKPQLWHAQHDTTIAYSLVRSRRRQREDRIFQAIFFTLAGGLDAYINAQLSNFPARVSVAPSTSGRVALSVSVPVGSLGRRR